MRGTAAAVLAACLAATVLAARSLERAPHAAPRESERAHPPERIVALSLAAAETLLAMLPPERVAAVHRYVAESPLSNVRGALRGAARIPSSAEAILSVAPDRVLTAPYVDRTLLEPLAHAGVPVHSVPAATDFEGIFDEMRRLGRRLGAPARAETAVARTRAAIADATRRVPTSGRRPRLLFLLGEERVAGRGTTHHELARLARARNVAAERGVSGLRRLPAEVLAGWSADAVVVPRERGSGSPLARALASDPRFGRLARARVIAIDAAHLSAASPDLVRGLRDLTRKLYP